MGVYAYILLKYLISKSQIDVSQETYYILNDPEEEHKIIEAGMDIAVEWLDMKGQQINRTIGMIKVYQIDGFIGNTFLFENATEIEMEQ